MARSDLRSAQRVQQRPPRWTEFILRAYAKATTRVARINLRPGERAGGSPKPRNTSGDMTVVPRLDPTRPRDARGSFRPDARARLAAALLRWHPLKKKNEKSVETRRLHGRACARALPSAPRRIIPCTDRRDRVPRCADGRAFVSTWRHERRDGRMRCTSVKPCDNRASDVYGRVPRRARFDDAISSSGKCFVEFAFGDIRWLGGSAFGELLEAELSDPWRGTDCFSHSVEDCEA